MVMVDAPPPRSCALRKPSHWEHLESPFCLSHCTTPNAVSLGFPGLAHCPSPIQSQVRPSQVSVCRFNRAPITVRFYMECLCALAGAAAPPADSYTSLGLRLASCISFIPGDFPVLWATKIRLEMRPRLTVSTHPVRASILGCSHSAISSPHGPFICGSILWVQISFSSSTQNTSYMIKKM